MNRTYFPLFILLVSLLVCVSCRTQHEAIMGDAIRFGDDVTTTYTHKDGKFKNLYYQSDPVSLYTKNGVDKKEVANLKSFIRQKKQGHQTTGYYALDLGLDRIEYVRKHQFKNDPNTKYFIVYMTDGLDNASVQLAKNKKQLWFINSEDQYVKRIQKKIKNAMGVCKPRQNTFQIFPILFVGKDMQANLAKRGLTTKEDILKAANEDMQSYRGASKGAAVPEVILGTDFKEITRDFQELFASSGFEFYVPTGYRNQRVRMILENDKKEKIQIEGTLKKKWFKWCLTDIQYPDNVTVMKSASGKPKPIKELYAINDSKELSAVFRLEEIHLNDKKFHIKHATQEHGKYFETNTEYELSKLANTNAYVLLIMDESTSLGDQTKNEQKAMEDILDIVLKSTSPTKTSAK